MEKFRIIIQLTRLDKPIGFFLLFWPCVWGLTLGYYFNGETILYLKYIILFFLGSVLMRSAGCIFNDIIDRDFDKKVERTKERPIAAEKISILEAFWSSFKLVAPYRLWRSGIYYFTSNYAGHPFCCVHCTALKGCDD